MNPVIQWLSEDDNPAVKYRTQTEILGEPTYTRGRRRQYISREIYFRDEKIYNQSNILFKNGGVL